MTWLTEPESDRAYWQIIDRQGRPRDTILTDISSPWPGQPTVPDEEPTRAYWDWLMQAPSPSTGPPPDEDPDQTYWPAIERQGRPPDAVLADLESPWPGPPTGPDEELTRADWEWVFAHAPATLELADWVEEIEPDDPGAAELADPAPAEPAPPPALAPVGPDVLARLRETASTTTVPAVDYTALNPQQLETVQYPPGPVLVVAGPGTGKTRVIAHRIAYLVESGAADPATILAVTFTRQAAREMRHRLADLLDEDTAKAINACTFHSLGYHILQAEVDRLEESAPLAQVLGRHGHFRVYGNGNGDAAIRKALESLGLDEGRWPLPRLHEYISQAKSQLLTPAEALQTAGARALDQHLARIYHAYEDALREANAVDYDDLLAWPLRLLYGDRDIQAYWREHCQHILVDEFQDTNSLQYELLRVLAEDHHSVTVVCSPAQSIYSWRGADGPLVLGHFQEDFDPAQVVLGQHYRCTQTILHAAQALIEGRGYGEQALATSNEPGGPITVAAATSGAAESRFIVQEIATLQAAGYAYRDMAILYRTRSQGRDLERVLLRAGIPYLLIGEQRFFRRPEVRHLLAYLRLAHDPQDDIALSRALAAPPCRVGERAKARELLVDRFDSIRLEGLREAQAKNLPDWLQAKLAEFLDFVTIDLPATNAGATASELVDYILGQPWYAAWLQAQNARERQQISLTTLRQLASHHDHLPPETSLAEFLAEIWDLEEYDLWDVPLDGDGGGVPADDPGAVILSTIHAAKGREYPVVFVAGFEDGLLPHTRSQGTARELEEERRLAYVALTRAQQYLYLSFAQERLQDDGQVTTHRPSRFLSHIPRELLTVQRVGG